ncbi:MAG: site-2 protease family protein [Bacteroidota bacterium]
MKWSLYLGKYWGIKVFIHWTFLILIGWIAISGANQGQNVNDILLTLLFVLTLFFCVTLHEFGHALAAKRFNYKTRDITLLPIGGLARLESMPANPKQELIVALAGPAVNLVISGLLLTILELTNGIPSGSALAPVSGANFFFLLMVVNFLLAIFNLIPAFPMDGGRVLRALLTFNMPRERATRIATSIGQLLAIVFVFWGLFFNPFLIVIGIFVYLGAQAEMVFTQSNSILHGHTVGDIIMHDFHSLHVDDTISRAVEKLLDSDAKDFAVMDGADMVGTLNRSEIIKAVAQHDVETTVGKIMNTELKTITPDTPLEKIYNEQQNTTNSLMPVVQNSRIIGVLDLENVMEFILVKKALAKSRGI